LKNKKIKLALLWSKYSGGVTSVNDLVLGLDKKRFNVIFIYLSGYGVEKNLIEEAGYKVCYLSGAKQIRNFNFPVLLKLIRIVKEHKIDILHCHGHKCTVYGAIAAVMAKTPTVLAHVHGLRRSRTIRRKMLNYLLFKRINRILPVCESVRDDVLNNNWRLSPSKVTTLDNSVDFKRFSTIEIDKNTAKQKLGFKADEYVVGTVARLGPFKGQDYLINAFYKFRKKFDNSHLIFAGEGPVRENLENLADEFGIADRVHFLGMRGDIEYVFRALDCFVLPSTDSEGLPRALLEAMAAGVPCVGTRVGGTPDVLGKRYGFVVEPKDANALAEAITTIAKYSEEQRKKLIADSIERVRQKYSHEVAFENLKNIYLEMFDVIEQKNAKV